MSKLNKTQIYAIRWLLSEGKTHETIASELDINLEQVTKTIEKYGASVSREPVIQTKQSQAKTSNMITETSGKRTKNVAIMTKEASEQHDAMRPKMRPNNNEQSIFRPKNNG